MLRKANFKIERNGETLIETTMEEHEKIGVVILKHHVNEDLLNDIIFYGKIQNMPQKYNNFLDGIEMINKTIGDIYSLNHSKWFEKKKFLSNLYQDTAEALGYNCHINISC